MDLDLDLESRIKAHGQSFDSLLKLIPVQYYITKELTEEEQNSKYQHNKKRSAPKQEIKERTKKAKKAKLDPENVKSITQVQAEMANHSKDSDEDEDDEDEDDNDVDMVDSDEEQAVDDDSEAPVMDKRKSAHDFEGLAERAQAQATQAPTMAPKSISELRKKLEERLSKLRGRRGAPDAGAAANKPTSRQAILEARLKRKKDKKASQKLAKEKRAAGGSEGLIVAENAEHTGSSGGRPSASSINDKGEVKFSKFEFDGLQKKKKGPTDAQGQLKMVEAHKEKMAALKVSDPEKANELKEKDSWRKAAQLAMGEKVKDDVKLLKKTIRREETFKKKSAKDWGERKSTVTKHKDQKQKKREENLKARIDAGRDKGKKDKDQKGKKGGAKGGHKGGKPKARAGFEGKNGKKPAKK